MNTDSNQIRSTVCDYLEANVEKFISLCTSDNPAEESYEPEQFRGDVEEMKASGS
jgi:hypothetical protein